MINAVVIDDQESAIKILSELLSGYTDVEVVGSAKNAQEGLDCIVRNKPDVVFLDIEMPDKDGFALYDQLKDLHFSTKVIFVTGYDKALQAYDYGAFDYLMKPIHPQRLRKAIQRVILEEKEKNTVRKKYSFSTGNGKVWIDPDDVLGCIAKGNYTEVFLSSGKQVVVIEQIGKIHPILGSHFVRCHRSALVNVYSIEELDTYNMMVKTKCGQPSIKFPISRTGLQIIKESLKTIEF